MMEECNMPKIQCEKHGVQFGIKLCQHLRNDIYDNNIKKYNFRKIYYEEYMSEYYLCMDCFKRYNIEKEEVLSEIKIVCLECAKDKIVPK